MSRERWAKYADRPNLRRALMVADERARSTSTTDVLYTEHIVLLGKRLASRHNSVARAVSDALRDAGIPFILTLVGAHGCQSQRFLRIRVLEGEEARTEQMRRLMRRHEMEPDERPAIEAQMVALDAEMEGRTP